MIVEGMMRRDHTVVAAGQAAVVVLAWAYDGAGLDMSMPGMVMAPAARSPPAYGLLLFLMWWIMMIAMMVPGAAPMILLFAAISRKHEARSDPFVPTGIFLAAYLVVWGAFSLIATGLQWALDAAGLLSAMAVTNAMLGGSILVAAGVYQLTPMKQACLRRCRGPVQFLTERWQPGAAGVFAWALPTDSIALAAAGS